MKAGKFKIAKAAVVHILCWALFLYVPFSHHQPGLQRPPGMAIGHLDTGLLPGSVKAMPQANFNSFDNNHFKKRSIVTGIMQVLVFYLNAYWLFAIIYIQRKRKFSYALSLFFIAVLYGILHYAIVDFPQGNDWPMLNFGFIFPFIMVVAASTAFALLRERIKTTERERELENQNLQSELAVLRSQINPHFIFNVLNGMVSLARKKSDKLEPMLIKLSDLMRHSLYDADIPEVTLQSEVNYIENYIEIQRLRFDEELILKVDIEHPEKPYLIAPMLLIPFIENAFKHGMKISEGAISINLKIEGNQLDLRVMNRFNKHEINDGEAGGIGLKNVKRRLELLYPQRYNLTITEKIDFFVVNLQLKLDDEKDKMHRGR